MPSEVAEEIVLTHPAQSPTSNFREFQTLDIIGVANVPVLNGPTVPAGFYHWVLASSLLHNQGNVTRIMEIGVRHADTGTFVSLNVVNNNDQSVPISRATVLPAGYSMRGEINTLGLGFRIDLRIHFLQLIEGEVFPAL